MIPSSTNDCKFSKAYQSTQVGISQFSANGEMALVHAARQGDLQAFNRLILAYQDSTFTQAFYLLGDSVAAENIVHEAFITTYKVLPTYPSESFRRLLFRTVMAKCLDELHRRKKHPSMRFEPIDTGGEDLETPYGLAVSAENQGEFLIHASDQYVLRCLNCLDMEYRTVIVLVDILGMRYGEAAEILGCQPGIVKNRLAHARHQMQRFFQESVHVLLPT